MEKGWNAMFDWFLTRYKTLLFYFEKHRWAAILLILTIAAALVHSMGLAKKIGSSMVSESDRGEVLVKLEFPTRYDLSRTESRLKEAVALIRDVPEIRHTLTTIGKVEGVLGQSSEGVYLAQILLKFSERDQRGLTIYDLQHEVRTRLAAFPDSIITVSMPSVMGGQMSEVEMEIAGEDLNTLLPGNTRS
jgi:HAE1 family hydrophobic/amphiphilic exporter-1